MGPDRKSLEFRPYIILVRKHGETYRSSSGGTQAEKLEVVGSSPAGAGPMPRTMFSCLWNFFLPRLNWCCWHRKSLSAYFHILFNMSNALLAVSGPAFGNMDITVYDVYSVTSETAIYSAPEAVTIFSGRSWTWALVDLDARGFMTPRPFAISNSVSISYKNYVLSTTSQATNFYISLIGTSTSLKSGINDKPWTITVYIPST